jgi:hypothetical protein
VKIRCTLLLAGVALSAWASCAPAAVEQIYSNGFDALQNPIGPGWDPSLPLSKTNSGDPNPALFHTQFLGDFGGTDRVQLHLNLPQKVSTITLSFDVLLLRTWDGNDPTPIQNPRPGEPTTIGGPDIFGYGYNNTTVLEDTFTHGAGKQTYCLGRASPCDRPSDVGFKNDPSFDYALEDKLGYAVVLDPHDPNAPQVGTKMSLVYHLTSGPIPYSGSDIDFFFFSKGLQVHNPTTESVARLSDESWGLDNVKVGVTFVPEPRIYALLLVGLLLSSYAATRRSRLQR